MNKYGGVTSHSNGLWGRRLNEEDNKPPCQYSVDNDGGRVSSTIYIGLLALLQILLCSSSWDFILD